ncbi:MAG: DUF4870 domain-containing protein [Verrucomicrobia bacterium]|nr:DUF4870 domain-containing protein [Verrucomicrobiota bacterium]
METPVYTIPPVISQPRGNDKAWSIFSHLSGFVGLPFLLPLVVYLAMRGDSEYATANAREALNFHLSLVIYTICCIPLIFLFGLGAVLIGGMWLASLVLSIVAAIKASEGGCYHYPLTLRLVS